MANSNKYILLDDSLIGGLPRMYSDDCYFELAVCAFCVAILYMHTYFVRTLVPITNVYQLTLAWALDVDAKSGSVCASFILYPAFQYET